MNYLETLTETIETPKVQVLYFKNEIWYYQEKTIENN